MKKIWPLSLVSGLGAAWILLAQANPAQENIAGIPSQPAPVHFVWGMVAKTSASKDWFPISGDTRLNSGDKLRMYLRLKQRCYVYVLLKDAAGGISLIYPANLKEKESRVELEKDLFLPEKNLFFQLDTQTGAEVCYLVGAARPLLELEKLLRKYQTEKTGQTNTASAIVTHIRSLRKTHGTLNSTAERPVKTAGTVRTGKEEIPAELLRSAVEIQAQDFYCKTFTIEHGK